MTDHLREIDDLAARCIGEAIELLPKYDECQTKGERQEKVQSLLIRLRAIQHEADYLRKESAK